MLKRKIYDELLNWKKTKDRECLLIKGARQIGKTFIIDKFGKDNYKSYIYINFIERPELKTIFDGNLSAEEIYRGISLLINNVNFIMNDTLIFLDEIQECPNARTAIKFLAIDNKYDVIASGSLLGISYKEVSSIPVGYEKQITMHSLDFEEFLWAKGFNNSIALLKENFDEKKKIKTEINNAMLTSLREYMTVGGMPSVINKYIDTNNFNEVHQEQMKIINSYLDDIAKYASLNERPKVKNCYLSIPKQLSKENKKFQFSVVEKDGTKRKFGNSLEWLRDANLVNFCYNISTPTFPINSYEVQDYFKIYMNDIGLLVAMYGFEMKSQIISNKLTGPTKGGLYENLIADFFIKKGYSLHYYKSSDNTQEIEFLITDKDANIIPVEVKSGNGATISLNNFMLKFNSKYGYKLISGNIGVAGDKITLPLYMALFV